jgi:hypothetical protein
MCEASGSSTTKCKSDLQRPWRLGRLNINLRRFDSGNGTAAAEHEQGDGNKNWN